MDIKLIKIKVPAETHRQLRILAAERGTTMTAVILEAIAEKLAAESREARP
ncbi:MAG TPA: hypothetical protein VIG24_14765 [Acidimicrobiia bacterium]